MINGLESLPAIIAIKDMSSIDGVPRYFQITQGFAKIFGWDKPETSYGLTDYDIPSLIRKGSADEYIEIDHLSFSHKKKFLTLEILECKDNWEVVLVEKQPILTNHVMLQAFPVNKTPLFHLAKKLFKNNSDKRVWRLGDDYPTLSLTKRQQQCLFYLIHGKTAKQTGQVLGISHRTVETHLNHIKIILECPTEGDLIEKAFNEGFAYFVPMSLVSGCIKKFYWI